MSKLIEYFMRLFRPGEYAKTLEAENTRMKGILSADPEVLRAEFDKRMGGGSVSFMPHPIVALIVGAFKSMLDETPHDNYVEFTLIDGKTRSQYAFSLMRVADGKLSPHHLRREAERIATGLRNLYSGPQETPLPWDPPTGGGRG